MTTPHLTTVPGLDPKPTQGIAGDPAQGLLPLAGRADVLDALESVVTGQRSDAPAGGFQRGPTVIHNE